MLFFSPTLLLGCQCSTTKRFALSTCPSQPHKLPVLNKVKKTNESLVLSTWNIRRGLFVRELELKKMLQDENSDVMFLTETDTTAL